MDLSLLLEITLLLAALVLAYLVYDQYLKSQRDIHELALQEQSNIAPSRKSDESAVYRSNLVPNEMPLITGLQIRQGFKLRDGNIRDIWSVVMHQKCSNFTFYIDDDKSTETKTLSSTQLNSSFKQLQSWISTHGVEKLGSCLANGSIEGFITAMTCFTNGISFQAFDQIPRVQPDVDVLLIQKSQLAFAKRLSYKLIIVVNDNTSSHTDNVWNWDDIVDGTQIDEVYEYKYQPSYDQGTPLINSIGNQHHSYTHQNFVSAASSLVKSIPLGHEFSSKDVLLVNDFTNQVHYWSKIFAVLLFGGSIIFQSSSSSSSKNQQQLLDVITIHKPTLLLIEPRSAQELLLTSKEQLSWFQNIKLSRAQHLLSEIIFTTQAQLSHFESLRLIYITTQHISESSLSSSDLTSLRALTGSRIINERTLPQLSGPLTATNFYDYRIFTNRNLHNRGTASLSLEMKLFKTQGLDIEKRKGELCIRGFVIGRPINPDQLERAIEEGERVGSEGWMPTGLKGTFGRDGCFYEF